MQPESTILDQIEALCKEIISPENRPTDCQYELSERILSIIKSNRKEK
jgi:hypothetical protein